MPKDIKTHETVKNIKTFDRAATVGDKMKNTALRTKDAIAEQQPANSAEQSSEQYAVDKLSDKGKQAAQEVTLQANQTGRKAAEDTKETVQKIKERRMGKKTDATVSEVSASSSDTADVMEQARAPKERKKGKANTPKERGAQASRNASQPLRRQGQATKADSSELSQSAIKDRRREKSNGKEKAVKAEKNIKAGKASKPQARKATSAFGKQTAAQSHAVSRKTQQTTRAAHKAQQSARQAYDKTKKATKSAKAAAKATAKVVKGIIEGTKALVNAIIAGGWVAVLVILVICMAGFLFTSVYGIFFSGEATGSGKTMTDVITQLNAEYYRKFELVKNNVLHDEVVIDTSHGNMSIAWDEVLAVYAVKVNTDPENPMEVMTVTVEKEDILREIMNDMNTFTYSVKVVPKERTVSYTDENGNESQRNETVREVVLTIAIVQKSAAEMAAALHMTQAQQAQVQELLSAEYSTVWAQLLGGYRMGSGEILPGDSSYIGTGIFAFPLQSGTYRVSSQYGYRSDPFTGKTKFHSGLDLAAAEGTPILAAADGVVTVANATDAWGYGWGYHVKLQHAGGYETLYAHCSAIAVRNRQTVKQGQGVAYVGTTGNSTGNHLHFEVCLDGTKQNPLEYFSVDS